MAAAERLERLLSDVQAVRASLTAFEDALLRAGVAVRDLHGAAMRVVGGDSPAATNLECAQGCLDASLIKAQARHRALAELADELLQRASAALSEPQPPAQQAIADELWAIRCGALQHELAQIARCHRDLFALLGESFAAMHIAARPPRVDLAPPSPSQPPPVPSRASKPPRARATPSVVDMRGLTDDDHGGGDKHTQAQRRALALHARGQSLATLPTAAATAVAERRMLRAEKLSGKPATTVTAAVEWCDVAAITVPRPRLQAVQQQQSKSPVVQEIRQLCSRFDFVHLPEDDSDGGISEDGAAAFFLHGAKAMAAAFPRGLPSIDARPARLARAADGVPRDTLVQLGTPLAVSFRVVPPPQRSGSGSKHPPVFAAVMCNESTTFAAALQSALKNAPPNFPPASTFTVARVCPSILFACPFTSILTHVGLQICGTIEYIQDLSLVVRDLVYTRLCMDYGRTPHFAFEPRNDNVFKEEALARCGDLATSIPMERVSVLPSSDIKRLFQIRIIGIENPRFSVCFSLHTHRSLSPTNGFF